MLTDGFQIMLAEVVGTAILIILGDGVVAGVLLTRSKAQNAGWIVITTGWALAVAVGVYAIGGLTGAHLNPAVTIGLASIGKVGWDLVPWYLVGRDGGRLPGRRRRLAALHAALGDHGRPGPQARRLLDRTRGAQHREQPDQRDHRHVHARLRRARHHVEPARRGTRGAAGRLPGVEHRPLARRPDRVRHQSRP